MWWYACWTTFVVFLYSLAAIISKKTNEKFICGYYIYYMDTKEKMSKEIVVMIQPSLYKQFKDKCAENYVQVSEVVRQFIRDYLKGDK